jgi:ketopantoate reductase
VCAQVLGEAAFTTRMFEKLIWICAFMLVGALHRCSVGEVSNNHNNTDNDTDNNNKNNNNNKQ